MTGETLEAALHELVDAGINVIPVMADGTKRPLGQWKHWQHEHQTRTVLDTWPTDYGVGIITGTISGNLEMLEAEGRASHHLPGIADLADASGLGNLWQRVNTGWIEMSPSGGFHWLYRVDGTVPGNTKIAATADHVTLIETRGEGGFVVVAPTGGTTHETGKAWIRLAGSPATIPTLTLEERANLHALFATLDERPEPATPTTPTPNAFTTANRDGDVKPGDDYETRTDWNDILTPHGWTHIHTRGHERFWRRPGKTIGISATTGHADDRDRLYVFTSSTVFQPETPYTKFGAYALLNHNGDHTAAARALNRDGYGKRTERHLTVVPAPETDGTAALQPVAHVDSTPATLTDDGNARLLATRHGHQIRYVAKRGEWLTWTGTRWEGDHTARIVELAKDTIHAIDTGADSELRKHVNRSLSRRSLEAMCALARSIPELVILPDELDAHPQALNTPDGTVDLTTGTINPPHREKLHTRATAVTPDGRATPRWDQFLEQTFHGNAELIAFVQRLAGYSASGVVTRHVLPFLHGAGGNGKSVFLDVLRAILGDYAATTPAKFLMAGTNQHETEIARLAGLRLVISSEVNENDRFDEAKVKLLTGGDALTARFMHQNHFTFTPTHHLWLMGNHQPRVSAGGASFWRRLRLIPFTNTVTDTDRVEGLDRILIDQEGPGILQWVIEGAIAAHRDGLTEPSVVMAATNAYAEEEDHLARFIEDRIETSSAGREDTADVRTAYEGWCREQGELPVSPQTFGRELRTRLDITPYRANGRRYYRGITLYTADESSVTDPGDVWGRR